MRIDRIALILVALLALTPGAAGAQGAPGLTAYVRPDQRWSVLYPAERLAPEDLPGGAVAFVSPGRDAFALVEIGRAHV